MSPDSWSSILDGFERDIALAVSGGSPEAWAPPAGVGPLPEGLVDRARRVLDAQADAIAALASRKHDAGTQLGALASMPLDSPSVRPLLLDVRG